MLDQKTKTAVKDHFDEIRPQLEQRYPDVEDRDWQDAKSNPEQFVKTAAKSTGQSEDTVAEQLKLIVQQYTPSR